MKSITLALSLFWLISINSHAQSIYQKLEDIEDKLEDIQFEQDMREIRRLHEQNQKLREQNLRENLGSSNKTIQPREKNSSSSNNKICYVIWNGEHFDKLRNKQPNLFFIHIVDDNNQPFIVVYLPKSYEKKQSKISNLVKLHIEEIKRTCR